MNNSVKISLAYDLLLGLFVLACVLVGGWLPSTLQIVQIFICMLIIGHVGRLSSSIVRLQVVSSLPSSFLIGLTVVSCIIMSLGLGIRQNIVYMIYMIGAFSLVPNLKKRIE